MATVTSLTAERMIAIEASSVVDGEVVGDNLILTTFGGTEIDAGSVRGPIGSPGISNETLDAGLDEHMPVGSVVDYIGIVSPNARWIVMTGQTVANAQTLYPELWPRLQASMKSGSSMVCPDTRGKASVGYDAAQSEFNLIGKTGGAKTHVLTTAQLPAAPVSVNPPPTNVSVDPPSTLMWVNPTQGTTDHTGTDHVHYVNGVTELNGSHVHTFSNIPGGTPEGVLIASSSPTSYTLGAGAPTQVYAMDVDAMDPAGYHAHSMNFNTGGMSNNHQHTFTPPAFLINVDIPAFNSVVDIAAFNSANLGSGEAHNIIQPYVTFTKILKVA